MLKSTSLPARWTPWLLGLISISLLTACAGSYQFRLKSSDPRQVVSVLVVVLPEAEFPATPDPAAVAKLVSGLDKYYGYVEYGLAGDASKSVSWQLLNESLAKLQARHETSSESAQQRVFYVPDNIFNGRPDLGIAVLAKTDDGTYRISTCSHAEFKKHQGVLVIDVTAGAITRTP